MKAQEITATRMSITSALPKTRPETTTTVMAVPGAAVLLPLAAASGGLLWLCYFPVACGWLAWVALVPLLALVRSPARPVIVYLSAYVGGLCFYGPVTQWMRVADPRMYFTWGILAAYCAVYFPLVILFVRYLDRRTWLPLTVTLPIMWTSFELFRSQFATGFSWYLIGHTQHNWLPIIQVADITGAYGVSFLVVAVNAVIAEVLWTRPDIRRMIASACESRSGKSLVFAQVAAVALLFGSVLAYGYYRLGENTLTPGPRIALVQGNLSTQIRNQANMEENVAFHYGSLSNLAAAYHPDLIVWPETSYPGGLRLIDEGVAVESLSKEWVKSQENLRNTLDEINRRWPTYVLIGMNSLVMETDGRSRFYNSALLVDGQGEVAGRYDKMHRVPFGEYVPLRESLPFMNKLAPYDFEYGVAAGQNFTRFPVKSKGGDRVYTFGVVICYEDTVPEIARMYGGGAEKTTDFLLNISNDGWFDGTAEHAEHLAICRFRAVECRRSVARAVNMGVSAVVDSNGRVLRPKPTLMPDHIQYFAGCAPAGSMTAFPWMALAMHLVVKPHVWCIPGDTTEQEGLPEADWGQFKKTSGVLLAVIPIDSRSSFYARFGDWLPWSCWILFGGMLVIARFWHRTPT